ncbi:ribonuclease H-like domain-containing protein [Tanacetum coccineum]
MVLCEYSTSKQQRNEAVDKKGRLEPSYLRPFQEQLRRLFMEWTCQRNLGSSKTSLVGIANSKKMQKAVDPSKPEISDSDDTSNEHSSCQSNDSEGSFGNPSEHSSESELESISIPNEMSTSKSIIANEKVVSESKEVEPSCVTHVKTPRQQMKNQETHKVNRKNWDEMMERKIGEDAELKKQRVFNTGNGVAKPVWNNANRVYRVNHFVPRPVQLNAVRCNVNTGKANVNIVRANVNSVSAKMIIHSRTWRIEHHKVLFTETECLVVSPDFKMPDENQILLKVPRQHNMYSFDMKTPSLTKDYACLIAKATSDESKLWHRRVKIIRSDNGTEFKNRDMLEFCGNKGIKQEYSNART